MALIRAGRPLAKRVPVLGSVAEQLNMHDVG